MTKKMLALLLLAAATPAAAQQDMSKVEVRTEQVAPGVHNLIGAGGNIGVSTGPDGTFIIDDQFAPLTPKIVEALKKIDDKPVRFVLNTHWHFDHTGGNENLGKAGTLIVAHDNVRTRMSTDQFMEALQQRIPASPAVALPVVTFDSSTTFHINGDAIRAVHVPHAHTDGDSLVQFTKANVVHMGDVFNNTSFPFIDLSSGGSAAGLIAGLAKGIALGNAQTRYIPGHGAVASRDELTAYHAMVADVVGNVRAGIAAKQSADQIVASKPAAAYDAKWGQGFIKADVFVRAIHASLTKKR
ncbi:MBL fold metallo-hydrolase [Sphingoaurantiacus capsulatus]|uniref:MBL fold metallo-hydrolase n=1 Tax=Sphingoaurantiacus capsulatus TaxID=1771310 RepID=A0ABV7XD91_9SPHN